jgi:spoIIIJ-associated protein
MSSCIEFEGKNLDLALKKACEKLAIQEKDLKHEVISYGSTGIFGLVGAKKARIRVFVPEKTERGKSKEAPALEPDHDFVPAESGLTEAEAFGKQVIEKIIQFIDPEASVQIEKKRNRSFYHIKSEDRGVLIGKKGQTLEAIQYIVEKIVLQKTRDPEGGDTRENEKVRLQIDVEGYLESREENLRTLAGKLAQKVKKTGKPVTVGHMSSHDRLIVHTELKHDHQVRTQSLGDGLLKKLVIFPKKADTRK